MNKQYYPILFVIPDFEDSEALRSNRYELVKRKLNTSIFDLANLFVEHKLGFSYQLMDIFLQQCNMEIAIEGDLDVPASLSKLRALMMGLYVHGVSPFIVPYGATISINEYSGISGPDSSKRDALKERGKVAVWTVEPVLSSIQISEQLAINEDIFYASTEYAKKWRKLTDQYELLIAVEDAAIASPQINNCAQSILHIWCALESLFPNIRAELSFRIAILLSQFNSSGAKRREYYKSVKSQYKVRSDITHGSNRKATFAQWKTSWNLLMETCKSVVEREALPDENVLMASIFS